MLMGQKRLKIAGENYLSLLFAYPSVSSLGPLDIVAGAGSATGRRNAHCAEYA
jgi:hypothetical protein